MAADHDFAGAAGHDFAGAAGHDFAGAAGHDFAGAVDAVLRRLGPGEVVTYGEVAREAGFPRRARAVGTLLARDGHRYPWWRVVTSAGRLVPGNEVDHARRLRAEGVTLVDGRVPMRRRAPF
jgi:methylated-DNA-protein-cysteine methyltransferase-like protein